LLANMVNEPSKCDVFSAAIMLFVLLSGGKVPQTENIDYKGMNLYELLQDDNERFWVEHSKISNMEYGQEFKELFNKMTYENPEQRWNLREVKKSAFFNGEIYTNEELTTIMSEKLAQAQQ